ncbi:MAG: Na+/H+ antiporter subunit E [Rhodospirillales bacterium]|nr:Na+/H+ antiporter subunit E [Rhodospirillales bacterium]
MLHAISLGLALFGLWLLLSGYFAALLLGLGVASVGIIVWVAHHMDVIDHEGHPIHLSGRVFLYWPWLIKEIVKSNFHVARAIVSRDMPIRPSIFKVRSTQKTELGQVVYANSITLTPGTVTNEVNKDILTIHALTSDTAGDLQTGEMDRRATNMEAHPDRNDPLVQTTGGSVK